MTGFEPRPETVEKAADAILGEESGYCGPGYGACGSLRVSRDHAAELARLVLAAVLPDVVADLRAEIAAEIETVRDEHFREFGNEENGPRNYDWALTRAAAVARGERSS